MSMNERTRNMVQAACAAGPRECGGVATGDGRTASSPPPTSRGRGCIPNYYGAPTASRTHEAATSRWLL